MLIPIGATLGVAVGACLVFDGLKATESDAGGASDASDSTHTTDATDAADAADATDLAEATDVADAGRTPDGTVDTAQGDGSEPDSGGGSNDLVCGPSGKPTCPAGLKCCAHGGGAPMTWTFPKNPCNTDCQTAGDGGYYGFECDEDSDCEGGKLCCAFRDDTGKGPPFTASKCQPRCPPSGGYEAGKELCQPVDDGGHCTKGRSCGGSSRAYVPPGFEWCQ
jgi:hypothetical protein